MRRIASTTKESRVDDERHPRTASLRFVLLCALVVLALGNSPLRAQIADGSFETGTFAGWVIEPLVGGVTNASCSVWGILDDGESLDFAGRIHAWPVNGDVFPRTPLLPTTFHATEGRFVAVQLPGCVHDHHISQVLTIPPDAATLRWDMLYANHHGSFIEGVQDIQVTLRNPATKALLPGGMLFRTVEGVAPLSIDTMTTF
ncbi:MAG TPA: hypothetical protein VK116_03680, partial [Planctomycetota bacterium]|nr:hypothetical protein [Planctomycetota bacterium]